MSTNHDHSDTGQDDAAHLLNQSNGKPPSFRADDCLLGILDNSRNGGDLMQLAVPGAGHVIVDFENESFLSDIDSDFDFFCSSPEHVQVKVGSRFELDQSRPLTEFIWKAAYYGSAGALLEDYNLFDVVELERWPNFTRIPHAQCCLPLCSLLARRASSISFAHRMLKVPQADAMRFYSAARAAGNLRLISSQPGRSEGSEQPDSIQTSQSSSDSSKFWTRLFGRFSGL